MTIIGIDNGKSGALAIIWPDRRASVYKTPLLGDALDEQGMCELLRMAEGDVHVYIEEARVMGKPGPDGKQRTHGAVGMLHYGVGHGLWRGMAAAIGLPYTIVNPRRWKRTLMDGMDQSKKDSSIIRAKQLFPGVLLRKNDRCRVDDHNMAEALLIAEYGRRSLAGVSVAVA